MWIALGKKEIVNNEVKKMECKGCKTEIGNSKICVRCGAGKAGHSGAR